MQSWGWIDIFSLLLTLTVCGGAIYVATQFMAQLAEGRQTTKENLKAKGVTVSRSGMSVKTNKQFDQDEYYAATQRGIMKAYNASTFGNKPDDSFDRPESQGSGSVPSKHCGAGTGTASSVPGAGNAAGVKTGTGRSASVGRHTPGKGGAGKRSSSHDADRASEHGQEKQRGRVHFVKQ